MSSATYTVDLQVDEAFTALVDAAELTQVAELTLATAGHPHGELSIVIGSDELVQELNQSYRGVDAPTDVLSFAAQEQTPGGPTLQPLPAELAAALNSYLGDIVIAYPYAERQAAHYQNSVAAELRLLTVHGVLHLLGYDHDTPKAEAAMWAQQNRVLATFGDNSLSQRVYAEDHL
ncbi:MAG: rRNA maturation RNase YbeY [Caldilineaceae bacterium]